MYGATKEIVKVGYEQKACVLTCFFICVMVLSSNVHYQFFFQHFRFFKIIKQLSIQLGKRRHKNDRLVRRDFDCFFFFNFILFFTVWETLFDDF
jgi:hypothetical protein